MYLNAMQCCPVKLKSKYNCASYLSGNTAVWWKLAYSAVNQNRCNIFLIKLFEGLLHITLAYFSLLFTCISLHFHACYSRLVAGFNISAILLFYRREVVYLYKEIGLSVNLKLFFDLL